MKEYIGEYTDFLVKIIKDKDVEELNISKQCSYCIYNLSYLRINK